MIEHIEKILFAYQRNRSLQEYIDRKKGENDDTEFHSASSAGSCLLKHHYKHKDIPYIADPKSTRITSLGSLIHRDFEEAVEWAKQNIELCNDILIKNNINPIGITHNSIIETEKVLVNKKIGVKCIFDYLEILPELKVAIVVDYKSAKAAAFSMQFTTKSDWQKNAQAKEKQDRMNGIYTGYELQLGTIGAMILQNISLVDNVILINAYYKKDDSVMKYKCITGNDPFEIKVNRLESVAHNEKNYANDKLFKAVYDYWELVNSAPEDILPGDIGAPMASWECKWSSGQCNYYEYCKEANPSFYL